MRIVPVIVGAIILLCIPLVWLLVQLMFPASDGLTSGFGASSSIDSGARIEIEALRQQVEGLHEKITALETDLDTLDEYFDHMVEAEP